MSQTIGLTGFITVTNAASSLYHLLGCTGSIGGAPYTINATVSAPEFATTRFQNSLVFGSHITGINEWSGTVNMRFPNPNALTGKCGLLTYANGYATDVVDWSLEISAAAIDVTSQANPCPVWRTYKPGLINWSGSYNAHVDDGITMDFPLQNGSATFKLDAVTPTANSFTGNIYSTNNGVSIVVDDKNTSSHSFRGTGALTSAGSTPLLPTGPITRPTVEEVTITVEGGRTYVGDAFWESVSITCPVDGLIEVAVNLRGTGDLVAN